MSIIIDNIQLDESNVEFNNAAEIVKHTNKLVYLTGKAGTGKTTFLKYLRETSKKNIVIVAPTGVAAINAAGQTIHSFFQIRPSIYVPNDKRLRTKPSLNDNDKSTVFDHFKYFKKKLEIIKGLELLIIDEISMVRSDLLDVIDRLLRIFRKKETEPFGGVQVVLVGDTFQLPPIAKNDEWLILSQYYKSPFFFSAKVIEQNKPVYIELKKIYRQNEKEFIELLNKVRINKVKEDDILLLNSRYTSNYEPNKKDKYIILATHNRNVETTNLTKLSELETEPNFFEATITGTFPDNSLPTDRVLQLKENAQIMFIKNDRSKRYFNGKIGTIKKIEEFTIIVEITDKNDDFKEIKVEKETWENVRYSWNDEQKKIEEEIIGTFIQFPLKLAWAITVHKSQGLTFEKVFADLSAAFAPGQVYVALSRCTTFNGLMLKSQINRTAIKTDNEVLVFAQNETPNTLIIKELNSGKADILYKSARYKIKKNEYSKAFDDLLKAYKYRNDIETDIFKRFFVYYFSRLYYSEKGLAKQQNKAKVFIQQNNFLKKEFDNISKQKGIMEGEIEKQNSVINVLLQKTDDFDNENKRIKLELKKKGNRIKTLNDKIETLENKISKQDTEIFRLSNLKWYHKLFGN